MLKKVVSYIVNIVSVLIIVMAILLLLSVVMTKSGDVPKVAGYSFFRVVTGSMEPEIRTDSIILVKDVDPADIKVGDVITFYFYGDDGTDTQGTVNTHRVTAVDFDGSQYTFRTKGDANAVEDNYTTAESDVIGREFFHSYPIGVLIRLVANPLVFFPFIILPLLAMIIYNLFMTVKSTKEIARLEEQEEIQKLLAELEKKKHCEAAENAERER